MLGATAFALTLLGASWAIGQEAPPNGPRDVDVRWDALMHATLIPAPGEKIEDATIVLHDGVIVSVAPGAQPPLGARTWDYTGLTVYPGLIDAHVAVDTPEPDPNAPGTHWHKRVKAQRSATDGDGAPDSLRKSLRDLGFTTALIAPKDGDFRGFGALVTLGSPKAAFTGGGGGRFGFGGQRDREHSKPKGSPKGQRVLADHLFQEVAFETGGFNGGSPTSTMGAVAIIRQTLLDADWRARSLAVYNRDPGRFEPLKPSDALDALGQNGSDATPLLFNTRDEQDELRAAKIAVEFGRKAMLVGSGREYRRLGPIVEDGLAIILPLNYPDEPKVSTYAQQESVTLKDLMDWEQAPTNARRLHDAGVTVALTTDKLKKRSDFFPNLRKAIDNGLSKDDALAMLTTAPAKLFGVADRLGAVKPGAVASLVVVDGDLFNKAGKIRDVWVEGARYEVTPAPGMDITGVWAARFGDAEPEEGTLTIRKGNAIQVEIPTFEAKEKATGVKTSENRVSFLVLGEEFKADGVFSLSAVVEGKEMFGTVVAPDGSTMPWSAKRTGDAPKKPDAKSGARDRDDDADHNDGDNDADKNGDDGSDDDVSKAPEALPLPFGAYGLLEHPKQEDIVVTNATIWTAAPAGIIKDGTLVLRGGKIAYVGPASRAPRVPGARVIDAKGRHITPGLIDAHSHTGIDSGLGGVNEVGQTITAEVRVQDVINPDAIALYRELAGGLTGANQLHGSANPIGGQNSVIKLRWGVDRPDDMRFEGAAPGIKFALGENPKRVGSGRYPDTRMGVEAIIRERFTAARDYMYQWDKYNSMSERERRLTMPPRRDLELDALAEVLRGERLVHSHSYRQDEILMLTRVARDFGFKIGTFQHVLEGYKVAEAIRDYAIGASTFSDWWAYKFEVYDAIPYNGAIMTEVGVPVTFNSDSNELARRLNTEAAKAVKYGGVPPEEAIKFVTYNAALQLKIDDRVGSLEKGKDADFVIWSGDPFSYASRADATYIDGREYFSREKDKQLRQRVRTERNRIIQKILAKKAKSGGKDSGDKPDREDMMRRMRERMGSRPPVAVSGAEGGSQ